MYSQNTSFVLLLDGVADIDELPIFEDEEVVLVG